MGFLNVHDAKRLEFARKIEELRPETENMSMVDKGVLIDREAVVIIGVNCKIKQGAMIGQKGFSFAFEEDLTPVDIYHAGGVKIGDFVEIGSGTSIARATLPGVYTEIGDHVKIDDRVHIGHNCKIGKKTIIPAGVTLGGGVEIGEKCWIGLGAVVIEKIKIGDYAVVGAGAVVIKDVPPGAVVAGNPATIRRYR